MRHPHCLKITQNVAFVSVLGVYGIRHLDSIMAYWLQDSSHRFPRYNEIVAGLMLVFPSSSTWIEDEKKSINRKEPSIVTLLPATSARYSVCCVVLCVVLL